MAYHHIEWSEKKQLLQTTVEHTYFLWATADRGKPLCPIPAYAEVTKPIQGQMPGFWDRWG